MKRTREENENLILELKVKFPRKEFRVNSNNNLQIKSGKKWTGGCECGIRKTFCKKHGGGAFCECEKIRSLCKKHGGGSFCECGINRSLCKTHGGGALCKCGISRSRCKEHGGGAFCECGIIRSICKEHGGGSLCKCGISRSVCKEHGGGGLCIKCKIKHKTNGKYCTKCHPDYIECLSGCSKIACKFIDEYQKITNQNITHVHYNIISKSTIGDEHRPKEWASKPVDGFYIDANGTNVAIEFLGDEYHGHVSKWEEDIQATNRFGEQYSHLFDKTKRTLQKLKDLGYKVMYVWEFDYKNLKALSSVQTIVREFNGELEY